ncbi:predicted protein [Nematostella vectensis]|uniref:Protein farnesyltransferase subunit beta n=1 Tax=Nematostella vectensis TaxID=45351 RepID=A7RRP9_NEMVE|nr:protein farnesyltransferase subunit beta [Nematostella vectensis]EDO45865.1 predicted protein [Nematostella vectensis]|eukprot:XP_001637928.1 predicted protein [Nematostella vectensis]
MALHSNKSVGELRFKDDGFPTATSKEQQAVELKIAKNYYSYLAVMDLDPEIPLIRQKHLNYVRRGLVRLSDSYECLDASRPWLCYWMLHSLKLLGEEVPLQQVSDIVGFLRRCQHPEGGFGGGPNQVPHLAPTYAAVCALSILGTEEAYNVIDRPALYNFIMRCRNLDGGFRMHVDGEVDIRGAYCAAVSASITNILTPELFAGTADWLKSCQTYEGGFSGEPGLEAHGGYTFCGFACLVLLGKEHIVNLKQLLRWAVNRQMKAEGGFQGRTNKLVDGCYSYWLGGLFPLLHSVLEAKQDNAISQEKWMFDQVALQDYVLVQCQYHAGGLIDKPGKSRDFYHTCYCLSGLSVAQHFMLGHRMNRNIVGGEHNLLKPVHPVYNICIESAVEAKKYFKSLPEL